MVLNEHPVLERIRRSAQTATKVDTHDLRFQAMGTQCAVRCRTMDAAAAVDFQQEVLAWVADFEATYSRFLPESLISRINAEAGRDWVEIDTDTERLFELCGQLVFTTRGAFDPTALPLIRLWNWKAERPSVPRVDAIRAAQELVGWTKVRRKPGAICLPVAGMCLDLGGIGKEFAVDRVLTMARQRGLEHVLVDFGQDIRVCGRPADKPAWHVGLQDPANPARCWAGVAVNNHAVATSGDYFRSFTIDGVRYGHILDPRTGYPVVHGCRSVTVIAPSCTVAGVLSTTAFILGAQEGINFISGHMGAEGCAITEQGRFMTRKFQTYVVS